MKLRELLEKRAKLVGEMRAITDAPAGEGGDLSADQATKFDSLKGWSSQRVRKILPVSRSSTQPNAE